MDLYDELPQSKLLYNDEFNQLLECTKQHCITVVDFLTLNSKELANLTQRSIVEVTKFQQLLIREYNKELAEEVSEIVPIETCPKASYFTTGDIIIDEVIGHGIHTNCITEIFGESSTGKSQLLMQLALSVQLPVLKGGLNGKAVYITTEGDLPTQRLEEMILQKKLFKENNVSQKKIFTVSCNDLITQEHILNVQLPILLERNKNDIKLIIIDSISHHLRVELESKSFRDSQDNRFYIEKMAENLLFLANKYSLAVVVANQVSDKPLIENIEPIKQYISDYDYQLGWFVGWKESTIMYRHKVNELGLSTKESSNVKYVKNSNNDSQNKSKNYHISMKKEIDDVLSDDEDYMLIEKEINRFLESSQGSQTSISSKSGNNTYQISNKVNNIGHNNSIPKDDNNDNVQSIMTDEDEILESIKKHNYKKRSIKKRKRKMDQCVPNLGLTWANYVSCRILLSKTYRASPMIKRGELNLYHGVDEATFWQKRRTLTSVYSKFCKPQSKTYVLNKRGVESVEV